MLINEERKGGDTINEDDVNIRPVFNGRNADSEIEEEKLNDGRAAASPNNAAGGENSRSSSDIDLLLEE